MAINVRKLGHALGAEVSGVDSADRSTIRRLAKSTAHFSRIACSYFAASR